MGVQTVTDLRAVSSAELARRLGDRAAAFLQLACYGQVGCPPPCACHWPGVERQTLSWALAVGLCTPDSTCPWIDAG